MVYAWFPEHISTTTSLPVGEKGLIGKHVYFSLFHYLAKCSWANSALWFIYRLVYFRLLFWSLWEHTAQSIAFCLQLRFPMSMAKIWLCWLGYVWFVSILQRCFLKISPKILRNMLQPVSESGPKLMKHADSEGLVVETGWVGPPESSWEPCVPDARLQWEGQTAASGRETGPTSRRCVCPALPEPFGYEEVCAMLKEIRKNLTREVNFHKTAE